MNYINNYLLFNKIRIRENTRNYIINFFIFKPKINNLPVKKYL